MATVIGDLMAPNGKYLKDGQEKTRWLKCGVVLQTDNGLRVKLECIPVGVGEDGLWMSVFEKDDQRPAQQAKPAQKPAQAGLDDDDTPF